MIPAMADAIVLPPRLDLSVVTKLYADLKDRAQQDVVLDLAEVTHLGALGLQLLIASARQAQETGKALSLDNVNDHVLDQMRLLGTCPETILEGQP